MSVAAALVVLASPFPVPFLLPNLLLLPHLLLLFKFHANYHYLIIQVIKPNITVYHEITPLLCPSNLFLVHLFPPPYKQQADDDNDDENATQIPHLSI